MAIAQVLQQQSKHILILGLIVLLAACGSGGGGGSKEDTKPDNFTFTAQTNVLQGIEVVSNAITVAGINKETDISVSAGGLYSIDNGTFTVAAGKVTSGKTVKVKLTSAITSYTAKSITLTIGGVTSTFTVTTVPYLTPSAFSFAAASGVALSSVSTSEAVTVTGFDLPVAINVSAGSEYKIGNGAFTSAAGTISKDQTVTLRTTAPATYGTTVNAVVTIGGVSETYKVTTIADTTAPTAQILFPTPVSLSSGATLKVRGTASDSQSTIASVSIGSVAATSTDGFATWTADVPLTMGVNNLTVTVVDGATTANTNSSAASVSVTRVADIAAAHIPDAVNPFTSVRSVVLDSANNRLLVSDSKGVNTLDLSSGARSLAVAVNNILTSIYSMVLGSSSNHLLIANSSSKIIVSVDVASGSSEIIASDTIPNAINVIGMPRGIAIDKSRNRALVVDSTQKSVIAIDLTTKARTVLSHDATLLENPRDIVIDSQNNRALIAGYYRGTVLAVDLESGIASIFSDGNNGENRFAYPEGLALDTVNNRVIVTASGVLPGNFVGLAGIYAINLTTKERTILSNEVIPNANTVLGTASRIVVDNQRSIAYVTDEDPSIDAVFVLDLISGERVIISK